MRVFYYRSDLIDNESNVSKKNDGKRLNYENYLNKGQWYIILDEAHKGQAELSLKKTTTMKWHKTAIFLIFRQLL